MTYSSLMGMAVAACLIAGAGMTVARAEEPTPKALTWVYECKPGTQCPTTCTNSGKDLFSTSDYASLTISQMNHQLFWIKVDTGQKTLDYIVGGEHLQCMISGARLAYVRYQEPGATTAAPK